MAARRASAASSASRNPASSPASRPSSNLFSDDYAESLNGSFADSEDARSVHRSASLRSVEPHIIENTENPFRDTPSRPTLPSTWQFQTTTGGMPSRSSTRKSLRGPFAGDTDASNGAPQPPGALSQAYAPARLLSHRSTSTSSSASFAQPMTPVNFSQGPSHPYGMYPQGLPVSRSASLASATTTRTPSQSLSNRRTPAHPYALYTQNVSTDSSDVNGSIPVGFSGNANQFHRRIGPEGEEQDIVGPDGHHEQLPPYTRYAHETHTKVVGATAGVPGTADDEEAGEDNDNPRSPMLEESHEAHENEADESTPLQNQISDTSGFGHGPFEKTWDEKNWKERRNTRIGCLPLWAFIVVMASLVIAGAVLGAVIGVAVGKRSDSSSASVTVTTSTASPTGVYGAGDGRGPAASVLTATSTTTMLDASPVVSIPTSLPPLPTGRYQLPLGEANMHNPACLISQQTDAWTCTLAPSLVQIEINECKNHNEYPQYNLTLTYLGSQPTYTYGEQPPDLPPQPLTLALDTSPGSQFGFAYQFQTTYDKVVILDEADLAPSGSSKTKRQWFNSNPQLWRQVQRTSVSPQDNPWFCKFRNTFIEGYVYVQNDTSAAAMSSASAAGAASMTTASWTQGGYSATGTATSSTVSSMATANGDGYGTSNPWTQNEGHTFGLSNPRRRDSGVLPNYTKQVKIVERRLSDVDDGQQGTCTKMQMDNGQWVPVRDGSGDQVEVYLTESDPTSMKKRSDAMAKRYFGITECYCQWQST